MAAYIFVRANASGYPDAARADSILVLSGIIAYVAGRQFQEGHCCRRPLWVLAAILVVANVGWGIYQYFIDADVYPLEGVGFRRGDVEGAGGFFVSGNHMAGFLILLFPVFLTLALNRASKPTSRIASLMIAAIALTGIALSTSRAGAFGAIIALCAVVIFGISQHIAHREKGAIPWVWPISMLAGGGLFSWFTLKVLMEVFDGKLLGSKAMRIDMWEMGLRLFSENQLVGGGAGSYQVKAREFPSTLTWYTAEQPGWEAEFAHGDYVQLLAEYGAVGAIAVLVVIVLHGASTFRSAMGCLRRPRVDNLDGSTGEDIGYYISVGAACGLIGFSAQEVAEFNMHLLSNAVLAAFMLGLLVSSQSHDDSGSRELVFIKPHFLQLIPAVAAVLLVFGAVKYSRADWHDIQAELREGSAQPLLALVHARKAIELDPKSHSKLQRRAAILHEIADEESNALLQKQWLEKARDAYLAAKNIFPNDYYTVVNLAQVSRLLGRSEEAEAYYLEAIRLSPNHRSTWYYRGLLHFEQGEFNSALKLLEKATGMEWWGVEGRDVKREVKKMRRILEGGGDPSDGVHRVKLPGMRITRESDA